MANYNKEGGRSRFGGNGGGSHFSGNTARKPFFGNKGRGDTRQNDRPVSMYKATCGSCGRDCEVPFRPSGEKPVYCKDCFNNKGGNAGADRFPRKDFHTPIRPPFDTSRTNDALTKQLEAVNVKLERLIQAVEALASRKPALAQEESHDVTVFSPKKVSKKKTAKNK
ncbi:MAG: hypothetical protein G01um101448_184 [Parcubacteria group bacterium Gr01-1014_48]|nr:MAG: hypothetical protein Greene041614_732 [Parcubacteria group bacterium Greene0416_14]TSC74369.1 MAG: hypothetical protein G01um101448_184 [Parcubacteria group bacterium Gr01-1014_48]TSD00714.1 MAG: hypothetical protein Greene101415_714 [Parcubacteria group bacterium Greene1014_15]TSD07692.1 MAG: hypothetical protein Greene07144_825 [Parcubacteria group bacterium Greene0714_4]